jgi:hypothetical protein
MHLLFYVIFYSIPMPPFHETVRREMFKRDEGTCQNDNCVCRKVYGQNAQWRDGFAIQMAHYPDRHQPRVDFNPDNGRASCWAAHLIETIQTGNHRGASTMYEQFSSRSYEWIREHGFRDEKMPLQWYYDYADCLNRSDELGIEGLVLSAQENFGIGE